MGTVTVLQKTQTLVLKDEKLDGGSLCIQGFASDETLLLQFGLPFT